ncbi:MAG: DUF445 family protein [Balneolaceae bacterium]
MNEENKDYPKKISSVAKKTTRIYIRKLWNLINTYARLNELSEPGREPVNADAPRAEHSSRLLTVLKTIPWILFGCFILSFFSDFENSSLLVFGLNVPLDNLLRILSVSGLIGFLTNWIAVTMLFRPSARRPILGQGLIPAHKDRIAHRLAQAVSEDLINPDLIRRKIQDSRAITRFREEATIWLEEIVNDPEFRSELKLWAAEYTETTLTHPAVRKSLARKILSELESSLESHTIEKAAVKLYKLLRNDELERVIEETISRIPEKVERELHKIDELLDRIPGQIQTNGDVIEHVATRLLHRLIHRLDVYQLVKENIQRYDEQRLERMIRNATHEQLSYIKYLGAVLGVIGGLVIWQPMLSLFVISLLFVSTLLLDALLMRITSARKIR